MKVRDLRVNGGNEKDLAVLLRVAWEHVDDWGGEGLCLVILYKPIQWTQKVVEKDNFWGKVYL